MRKEGIFLKYIIMCGGRYGKWETPRHLIEINGEPLVMRTIRLLRSAGVDDIAISAEDAAFEKFGVPVLYHDNDYFATPEHSTGHWASAFYLTDEPTCYIFGDVVFSPQAIRTIVGYKTDGIMFFGSKKPFAPEYPKQHEEPFAFKVADVAKFHKAIEDHKRLADSGTYYRKPIAWELWFICRGADPAEWMRKIPESDYVAINDYTCDIDDKEDVARFRRCLL